MSEQAQVPDLGDRLRAEAREAAEDRFGPDVTTEQVQRVYDCEMEMFTFHCATGGDLDCTCGAHALYVGPAPAYTPKDFG